MCCFWCFVTEVLDRNGLGNTKYNDFFKLKKVKQTKINNFFSQNEYFENLGIFYIFFKILINSFYFVQVHFCF